MADSLRITRVQVRRDRLICTVQMGEGAPRQMNSLLAEKVLQDFPTLTQHICANDQGVRLTDVLADTSIPHVLEHLAVDYQAKACPDGVFVGTTEWLDAAAGTARVELSFQNDLSALAAVRAAAEYLSTVLLQRSEK